jgi:hypothetical protein
MSNPTVSHYDHETGETVIRDMNADELAVYKIMQDEIKAQAKAQADAAIAKQAVLDRLGITADEARMLLS